MRRFGWAAALGTTAALGALTVSSEAQGPAAPKARYYLDASTASGIMGNPTAVLLARSGSSEERQLMLRLGSTLSTTGGPAKAGHFMPAGMRLGASVPLATPIPSTGSAQPTRDNEPPKNSAA